MQLYEYIEILEKHPRDKMLKKGLGNPHSWRGDYYDLAFEIVENTTVGEMLDCANECLGKTFEGYKGGEYTMFEDTEIHVDNEGDYSSSRVLMKFFFELLLD